MHAKSVCDIHGTHDSVVSFLGTNTWQIVAYSFLRCDAKNWCDVSEHRSRWRRRRFYSPLGGANRYQAIHQNACRIHKNCGFSYCTCTQSVFYNCANFLDTHLTLRMLSTRDPNGRELCTFLINSNFWRRSILFRINRCFKARAAYRIASTVQ